jgi:hypothetical protein
MFVTLVSKLAAETADVQDMHDENSDKLSETFCSCEEYMPEFR